MNSSKYNIGDKIKSERDGMCYPIIKKTWKEHINTWVYCAKGMYSMFCVREESVVPCVEKAIPPPEPTKSNTGDNDSTCMTFFT